MKSVTSSSLIGPITGIFPIRGANNYSIAAQVPIATNQDTAEEDIHYVYVILANGVDRCG